MQEQASSTLAKDAELPWLLLQVSIVHLARKNCDLLCALPLWPVVST